MIVNVSVIKQTLLLKGTYWLVIISAHSERVWSTAYIFLVLENLLLISVDMCGMSALVEEGGQIRWGSLTDKKYFYGKKLNSYGALLKSGGAAAP